MKNDKLVPGLILVLIGAAILLGNFGYLHFHLDNIFRMWPVFLVIAGVNLVLANYKSPWTTILKISVVVVGIGIIVFGNFGDKYSFWRGRHWSFSSNDQDDNWDDNDSDDIHQPGITGNGTFNAPFQAGIKTAQLELSGEATVFKIVDSTSQLFAAEDANKGDRFEFSKGMQDSVYTIKFRLKDHNLHFGPGNNNTVIRLNPYPEWLIDVKTDVAGVDFDLSKYKIRQLQFDGDASGVKIKLGTPLASTNVEINSDVSGVDIYLPKNSAFSVETDSDLSGDNFDENDLNKIDDNHYETKDYNTAKTKFHIHTSGDLSGFNIKRY